jgi:hypothetical protein
MISLCDMVNTAENDVGYALREQRLAGFKEAVELLRPDIYGHLLMDCDWAMMEKYPDAEMCCGVLINPPYKENTNGG